MTTKITDISGGVCDFCGKRPATRLCDMPIGFMKWGGHPPGGTGPLIHEMTCDRRICDQCSTSPWNGVDLCPFCVDKIKNTKRGRSEVET